MPMNIRKKFQILTYNIGIIERDVSEILETGVRDHEIRWLRHPYRDRFFADPFLLDRDEGNYYIAAEEYIFWEEKGRIVLLTVSKDRFSLLGRKVLIEEPYHLSFPFCEEGGTALIPESVAAEKTFRYAYDRQKKEIIGRELWVSEGVIDGVYYTNKDGTEWLLASHREKPKEDLYLYRRTGGQYVKTNGGAPVMSDIEHTRGAGLFFTRNGKLYRPVQDSKGRYGRQTKIMEIGGIADDRIDCRDVLTVNSFNNPPFNETMHTFNAYDGFVIVDGSKDETRFPMKVIYKLRERIGQRNQ